MRIDVVTLFPDMFSATLDESILARGRKRGCLQLCCHQLRDYSPLGHSQVDDTVFGGGKGMLLRAEPIAACVEAVTEHLGVRPHIVYMSPTGSVLRQADAKRLAKQENLMVLCGHYEGVDQRVLDAYVDETISIGDYVLTGGELPAMVLIDTVSRMLPGILADEACFQEESHYDGCLEYPQYTRPEVWQGRAVPKVLLSGHHERIRRWRRQQSLRMTQAARPDLFAQLSLSDADKALLSQTEEQ